MNGYLQDGNGNKSSKRLAGFVLITIGIIMAVVTFCLSIYAHLGDSRTMLSIVDAFFLSGCGLLVGGVIETFTKRK
jgi:hypothetical protein